MIQVSGATPLSLTVLLGIFGLAVGSFLNVCIHRLPLRESVVFPASHCPRCRRDLAWFENIPVISWLVLRGRCRGCRQPISIQYPLVEMITGILFVLCALSVGPGWLLVDRLCLVAAMIVLFAIDLEHQILPDVITLPGIVAGLAFSLVAEPGWWPAVIGMLAGGGSLWLIAEAYYRLRHQEGLGGGDVKMLAMIGAFLGWKLMLLTLLISTMAGSIVGLGLMVAGRGDMGSKLPFGTFLAVATVFAALAGEPIVVGYIAYCCP